MSYWVIAVVILALGVIGQAAWRKHQKNRNETAWLNLFLLMMLLEVEARKARDRQRVKDRAPSDPT